jgi:hypothetical protein
MHLGEMKDLQDAILHCQMAVNLVDQNHPDKSKCLLFLGITHYLCFECLDKLKDFSASIPSAFPAVAQLQTSYPHGTLLAAYAWANAWHHNDNLPSALDGYGTAGSPAGRQVSIWDVPGLSQTCIGASINVGSLVMNFRMNWYHRQFDSWSGMKR